MNEYIYSVNDLVNHPQFIEAISKAFASLQNLRPPTVECL